MSELDLLCPISSAPSRKRGRATTKALRRESRKTASKMSLSRQAQSAARRNSLKCWAKAPEESVGFAASSNKPSALLDPAIERDLAALLKRLMEPEF